MKSLCEGIMIARFVLEELEGKTEKLHSEDIRTFLRQYR